MQITKNFIPLIVPCIFNSLELVLNVMKEALEIILGAGSSDDCQNEKGGRGGHNYLSFCMHACCVLCSLR